MKYLDILKSANPTQFANKLTEKVEEAEKKPGINAERKPIEQLLNFIIRQSEIMIVYIYICRCCLSDHKGVLFVIVYSNFIFIFEF